MKYNWKEQWNRPEWECVVNDSLLTSYPNAVVVGRRRFGYPCALAYKMSRNDKHVAVKFYNAYMSAVEAYVKESIRFEAKPICEMLVHEIEWNTKTALKLNQLQQMMEWFSEMLKLGARFKILDSCTVLASHPEGCAKVVYSKNECTTTVYFYKGVSKKTLLKNLKMKAQDSQEVDFEFFDWEVFKNLIVGA